MKNSKAQANKYKGGTDRDSQQSYHKNLSKINNRLWNHSWWQCISYVPLLNYISTDSKPCNNANPPNTGYITVSWLPSSTKTHECKRHDWKSQFKGSNRIGLNLEQTLVRFHWSHVHACVGYRHRRIIFHLHILLLFFNFIIDRDSCLVEKKCMNKIMNTTNLRKQHDF